MRKIQSLRVQFLRVHFFLAIPLALSFVACGPASGNISGTITAPVAVIVNNSIVIAIPCSSSCTQLGSTAANAAAAADGHTRCSMFPLVSMWLLPDRTTTGMEKSIISEHMVVPMPAPFSLRRAVSTSQCNLLRKARVSRRLPHPQRCSRRSVRS